MEEPRTTSLHVEEDEVPSMIIDEALNNSDEPQNQRGLELQQEVSIIDFNMDCQDVNKEDELVAETRGHNEEDGSTHPNNFVIKDQIENTFEFLLEFPATAHVESSKNNVHTKVNINNEYS